MKRIAPLFLMIVTFLAVMAIAEAGTPGELDPTFGDGGLVTAEIGDSSSVASVVVRADGKILVSISSGTNGLSDFMLARYDNQGTLDPAFGTGGIVTVDVNQSESGAEISLQEDGKIVMVGNTYDGSNRDLALLRFNEDGSLDTSFDDDGIISVDLGGDEGIIDLVLQADGKIVVTGSFDGPDYDDQYLFLGRFLSDGAPDLSFDGGVITSTVAQRGNGVALQPDGKIVVSAGPNDAHVLRFNPDGTPDTSFGAGGVTTLPTPTYKGGWDVAVQPDGKILLAADEVVSGNFNAGVARLTADGQLDSGFGNGGVAIFDSGQGFDEILDLTIAPEGKILAGGYWATADGNAMALFQLNGDGTPDTMFGDDGIALAASGRAAVVALQPDGKALLGGYSSFDVALARFLRFVPDEFAYLPVVRR